LRAAGILYEEVDCDKFSKYCDALEAITDTVEYPMVIMNRANSLELYYVVDDYNDVLLKGTIKGDYVLNPQISTDQLINNIINK
jgi:hypothetical protein